MFLVGKVDFFFSRPEEDEDQEVVVVRTIRPKVKKRKKTGQTIKLYLPKK